MVPIHLNKTSRLLMNLPAQIGCRRFPLYPSLPPRSPTHPKPFAQTTPEPPAETDAGSGSPSPWGEGRGEGDCGGPVPVGFLVEIASVRQQVHGEPRLPAKFQRFNARMVRRILL